MATTTTPITWSVNSSSIITANHIQVSSVYPAIVTDGDLLLQVNAIAADSTRAGKESGLSKLACSAYGKKLINLCYNPFLTYGVTWKAEPKLNGPDITTAASLPVIEDLLMKLASRQISGHAAKAAIAHHFDTLPKPAAHLLWLCLNKDLKAGVAESSIKAVDPSLIPIFAVMRAHLYEEKRITTFPVAAEPKLDGHRTTFIARDGSGGFFTRTGKIVPALDHMVEPTLKAIQHWATLTRIVTADDPVNAFLSNVFCVRGIPNIVLDGEMMSDGNFNETSGALRRQGEDADVRFHIFDLLSWDEFDAMGAVEVSYADRRIRVDSLVRSIQGTPMGERLTKTPFRIARSHDEIQAIYQADRAAGHEGTMVKKLDGFYHKKKSHDWLKLKNESDEDLPVIGVFQGQAGGKYENTIGGLIVERMLNGQPVEVRVSGIDDATRAEFWRLWCHDAALVGADPEVGYKGETFGVLGHSFSSEMKLLGKIAQIEFHEVTPDGSLRHPRLVMMRPDKDGEVEK